ncbi:ComF family protein [Cellulophaga baltica]|uniref:ComF family protein n=1 Tax=Cellulophaga TaxID=104264 RepID=UPI001C07B768|nr:MULTISPECIES: phosphoribosyltransferase family protein [Cellulophaga]MBU2995675.1 ComF family protein [Cellulophaga baltica]MDO6767069.1 phosphoribosyltransferase family protein [Cellulophaga sp. 1_MG-2023]
MNNWFVKIVNDINRILVPIGCFGCNAYLRKGERTLCTVCRNQIPLTEQNFHKENSFDRIFYGRVVIKKAVSFLFFTHNGIVKNLIHNLKYKNQEQIGDFLGDWCGTLLKNDPILQKIDLVVPVPLHKKKLNKRGYNQVSNFAKQVATHLNIKYEENALIKTRNTKTQTKKNRFLRWQNNQNLFQLNNEITVQNKNILIVDDVVTTGATLEACANAFKTENSVTIYFLTMAMVEKT